MKTTRSTLTGLLVGSLLYEKYFNINTNYSYEKILFPIAAVESSLNPTASNGSFTGLFQFGRAAAQQTGHYKKTDPVSSSIAFVKFTLDNSDQIGGFNPKSAVQVYLIHQQGAGGFRSLWNRVQSTPNKTITESVLLNNRLDSGIKTYREFWDSWDARLHEVNAKSIGKGLDSPDVKEILETLYKKNIQSILK